MRRKVIIMKSKIINYFKDIWNDKVKRATLLVFLIAPLVSYTIAEALNQRSVSKFFGFVTGSPVTFLLNYIIVLFTLSFTLVLKKNCSHAYDFLCMDWVWCG